MHGLVGSPLYVGALLSLYTSMCFLSSISVLRAFSVSLACPIEHLMLSPSSCLHICICRRFVHMLTRSQSKAGIVLHGEVGHPKVILVEAA